MLSVRVSVVLVLSVFWIVFLVFLSKFVRVVIAVFWMISCGSFSCEEMVSVCWVVLSVVRVLIVFCWMVGSGLESVFISVSIALS